jgi:hypothetical protein
MPDAVPSPLQRLVLAFYAFFAILFRAEVAAAVWRLREARRAGAPLPPPEIPGTRVAATTPIPEAKGALAAPVPPLARAPAPAEPPARPAPAAAPPAPAGPAAAPAVAPAAVAPAPPAPPPDHREALHLLAVLQREGRLVDFVEEDLTGFPDSAVGAAARTVHAGCRRALAELFTLEPVLRDAEGATVTVDRGFDPVAVRLTGNVVGEPPFRGALRHHGWRAREVKLAPPAAGGADPAVLAPAEVEL